MMQHITHHYTSLQLILLDDMPEFEEFVRFYGKVVINDFELTQSCGEWEDQSLGMGVFLAPSIVDHSCRPNAEVEFRGNRLVMRSLVDRQDTDIDATFFSYISEDETKVRREYLSKYFFFDCLCERCKDET